MDAIIDALLPFGAEHATEAIKVHYQRDDHHGHPKCDRLIELASKLAHPTAVVAGPTAFKPLAPAPDEERERQRLMLEWVEGMTPDAREQLKQRVVMNTKTAPWIVDLFSKADPLKSVTLRLAMAKVAGWKPGGEA